MGLSLFWCAFLFGPSKKKKNAMLFRRQVYLWVVQTALQASLNYFNWLTHCCVGVLHRFDFFFFFLYGTIIRTARSDKHTSWLVVSTFCMCFVLYIVVHEFSSHLYNKGTTQAKHVSPYPHEPPPQRLSHACSEAHEASQLLMQHQEAA